MPETAGNGRNVETCIYKGPHSNSIYKFPVFSPISPSPTGKFPCNNFRNLQQLTLKISKISQQISQYSVSLESWNILLGQTKLPVFWQNLHIPCVFPIGSTVKV